MQLSATYGQGKQRTENMRANTQNMQNSPGFQRVQGGNRNIFLSNEIFETLALLFNTSGAMFNDLPPRVVSSDRYKGMSHVYVKVVHLKESFSPVLKA